MRTREITPLLRVGFRFLRARSLSLGLLLTLAILPAARGQLYTETGLLTPAPDSDSSFGGNVAVSGDTLAVGGNGTAYVFTRGSAGWTRQQAVAAPYGDIALDGDTLVAGGVIYVRSGTTWTQQGSVTVTNVSETALQGDTLVVGTPYYASPPGAWHSDGAVHIYQRSGTTWTEQATLTQPPSYPQKEFGEQVALDGDTLLIGTGTGYNPGTVYVYTRSGTTWSAQGTLALPDVMGEDLDLAIEGDTAVVSDRRNWRFGIFTRSGTAWSLTQTVTYEHENMGSDYFFSMKLALQHGVLAVGVDGRDRLYLYKHTSGGWLLAQTLTTTTYNDYYFPRPTLFDGGKSLAVAGSRTGVRLFGQPLPPAPGSGWRDYDIGAVGAAGSSSDDGTTVTVRGAGPDIWDRADQFHFRSETLTGDGAIVAHITSAGSSQAWAKAGLMFRSDITSAAPEVTTFVTPGGHVGAQARATLGDFTSAQNDSWAGAPIWLMLVRTGDEFASYRSADGHTWTSLATTHVIMPATIHAGLAVSSHDAGALLNTGTFTDVDIVATVPPGGSGTPAAPTGLAVDAATDTSLYLSWTDASNNETGFELQRATGGGAFVALPALAANTTSFTDTGLTHSTTYSYRIRALGATNSAFSSVAVASTADGPPPLPSAWSGYDVGSPAIAGSDTAHPPAFAMHAAGTDIYGTADSFHYQFETVEGDATVVARVASLTNTNVWAKAGVMIRGSLSANSVNAAMLLSPAQASSFQVRATAGAATDVVPGPWVTPPYWVKLTRVDNTLTGYVSANGTTWTQVASREVVLPHQIYIGFAGCSHNPSVATTAEFDHAAVENTPPPPASDWTQQAWSASGSSFTTDHASGDIPASLTTTSGDIYGTADAGLFVWRQWSGNATFISRVGSVGNSDSWAKAGLMFRAGLDASSANAFVALTPGVGAVFQSRAAAAGSTATVGHSWVPGPNTLLKLARGGGTIQASFSTDNGTTWTSLGSVTDNLPANFYLGYAVSSHNPSVSTTATFARPE